MDAIAQGTIDGVRILAYVIAMLIVMVALVALANMIVGAVATPLGFDLTVQKILGWAFAPLAWIIGVPWSEAGVAGGLLGIKTVLNELLAYIEMAKLGADGLSPRSRADHDLCPVRLRQSRQPWHHDRRARGHGPGAAQRDRCAGAEDDSVGYARNPAYRRHCRRHDAGGKRRLMSTWDPTQYLAFSSERLQPALDLLARVALETPATIVDLGCGAGQRNESARRTLARCTNHRRRRLAGNAGASARRGT